MGSILLRRLMGLDYEVTYIHEGVECCSETCGDWVGFVKCQSGKETTENLQVH